AGRRAGAGVAADVLERGPGQLLQPGRDERPAPHVLRLLLDPDPLAGRAIAPQRRLERVDGPGVELLEPDDRDLAGLAHRLALRQQVVVDLARADQDAPHLVGPGRIVEQLLEPAVDL